jgi:hypothetical protein
MRCVVKRVRTLARWNNDSDDDHQSDPPGSRRTTVGALGGLVVGVERVVVALEVLLTAETVGAESADEDPEGILSQRLLAAIVGGQG